MVKSSVSISIVYGPLVAEICHYLRLLKGCGCVEWRLWALLFCLMNWNLCARAYITRLLSHFLFPLGLAGPTPIFFTVSINSFNVWEWLKRWYPIVRNFLLLIQSHANCWGGNSIVIFFSVFSCFFNYFLFFIFFKFYFFQF